MKDLLELLKFLTEKIGSFTIDTNTDSVEVGDLSLSIISNEEATLTFGDVKKILEFCDDLTIGVFEGKLYLELLFLPKKEVERK